MRRFLRILIMAALPAGPALALDEPVTWRDPDTGCAYLLTRSGGIAPKYRRDGAPDCPDASRAQPLISERSVEQGVDAVRRELERLGERFKR